MLKALIKAVLILIGFSVTAEGQAYDVQDWWAPGDIGIALYKSRREFPELTVTQDDQFVPEIDGSGSYCFIRAAFPKDRKQSAKSELNKMTCYLRDVQQRYAILILDLSDVSIQVWGNQFEYDYWEREGLPKVFHFPNQDINSRLFKALYLARDEKRFTHYDNCTKGEAYCSEEMTYNNSMDPKGDSIFASCILQYQFQEKIGSHCIFFYPNSHK